MVITMNKYKKYEFLATICVMAFILSMALVVLTKNKSIYTFTLNHSSVSQTEVSGMSDFELKVGYEQLADDFSSFWKKGYEVSGYTIAKANVYKLNALKAYYRAAYVFAIISFITGVYCFIVLSKCRLYKPFLYGSALAVFVTSLEALIIMRSDRPVLLGIRNMVLKEDYSYFADGDVLKTLLLPEYARFLALSYIALVFIMILIMVLIRGFIIFRGRPHRF